MTTSLQDLLGLQWPPVAVQFTAEPPKDLEHEGQPAPAGCAFWKRAAEGKAFHTLPEDHFGCAIGCHTHNVPMPEAKAKELQEMVEMMVGLEYVDPAEVATLPCRDAPLESASYAPLADAPFAPDVVLVRGSARQMMLLFEATQAERLGGWQAMGRPTCSAIPQAIASGEAVLSFGCIGNRVYAEMGHDELYCALPGAALERISKRLEQTIKANEELERFHRSR